MLLVEPYFGGSHRAWALGLQAHSSHEVLLVTHEAAFWRWRQQGSSLTLARQVEAMVAEHGRPDVLLVSTMVDLPALLGFTRRSLGEVPVVHDVHENQLTYPLGERQRPDVAAAITGWLGLAAADHVVFHSDFHRRELLSALPGFLHSFPDHRHEAELDAVEARSSVVPLGIETSRFDGRIEHPGPPIVLWNHRWEHDKDPEALFDALDVLAAREVPFRLALAGERTPTVPAAFAAARERFADRLVAFGDVDDDAYPDLLRRSDVVVSTATHEFFGLAVCEAMAAGACPVLPDRLSYPELLGGDRRRDQPLGAECLYEGSDDLVARLQRALTDEGHRRRLGERAKAEMARFDWEVVAPQNDALLQEVVAPRGMDIICNAVGTREVLGEIES